MKIDILKLRNLNWKLKSLICGVFSIFCLVCMNILLDDIENKIENYDYSQIYSETGVISDAYVKEYYDAENYRSHTVAYIEIDLENGKTITIDTGTKLSHEIGENIIVYTDGEHYDITQKGVAMDATNTIINFMVSCIIAFLLFIIWIFMFGWKGALIVFFIVMIWYGIQESV